jgi:hypothetical protein
MGTASEIVVMIGQLRSLAQLHTIRALAVSEPQARIALLRLAHEAANKEEAVARWRGYAGFKRFDPPFHILADGQDPSACDMAGRTWGLTNLRSPKENHDDNPAIEQPDFERLCA